MTAFRKTNLAINFHQIRILVRANLKSRYRDTFSGLLWVILQPIILYGAQAYVFHFILKLQVDNYLLFLLSGLIPWVFIMQSLEMGVGALVNQSRFLKSFTISPLVVVFSLVIENIFNFLIAFLLLVIPLSLHSKVSLIQTLLLPLPLLSLVVFTGSLTFFLSISQVFFRDVRFILSFALTVSYYLTPVLYPSQIIPEQLSLVAKVNPFRYIIEPFQILFSKNSVDTLWFYSLATSYFLSALMLLICLFTWRRTKNDIYLHI